MCELEDGTVLVSTTTEVKRWDIMKGTVIWFPSSITVFKMIELRRNTTIVSIATTAIKIWRLDTGECLHFLTQHNSILLGLVKLKEGYFATGEKGQIRVWDEDGCTIATYYTDCDKRCMRVDAMGSLVNGSLNRLETRKP